ncbi:MAG TPA: hypothetical protein VIX73_29550, partial [Kofleriaceae bacterium]
MATVEAGPRREELIRPVRWWKARPAFGVPEGSKLCEIPDGISRHGPFYVAELKAIAANAAEASEARYAALGYLVALHNSGRVDSDDVIEFLEALARSAAGPSQWFARRNALDALAHLLDGGAMHPRALASLVVLSQDPAFDPGQRDALSALATTGDPRAVEALTAWVAELAEAGAEHAAESASEIWPARWRDRARLFVHWLERCALRCDEVDAPVIVQPLRAAGVPAGRTHEVEDFLLEAAAKFTEDARMTSILAALLIACSDGDTERAGRRIDAYHRRRRLTRPQLAQLRAQIEGAPVHAAGVAA